MKTVKPFPSKTSTLSFWRTELSDIDELRTTENLPTECDVLIIGAGISGASVAYHLLGDGPEPLPSVTMLEARQVCSGATARNGGHCKLGWQNIPEICRKFGVEQGSDLADFMLAQIPALKDVVEKEGIECDFALRRSFDVFYDETVTQSARAAFDQYKEHIPYSKHVDFISGKYLEQITRVKGAKGAISVPACSLWPYKLVCGLLKVALAKGLNLQTNTYVTSTSQKPSEAGFYKIETTRGSIKARKILFATNGYTGAISPEYQNVIVPWKGINSRTVVNSDHIVPNLSNTYNLHNPFGNPEYINPRPDGSITVGGGKDTFEQDFDSYWNNHDDSTLIEPAKHYFDKYVSERFLDYASLDTSISHIWTGIMGRTVDGIPHIGTVPGKDNQYIMAGFNGGGMSFCFLTGKAVASMIRDDVPFEQTGLPGILKATEQRLKSAQRDAMKV